MTHNAFSYYALTITQLNKLQFGFCFPLNSSSFKSKCIHRRERIKYVRKLHFHRRSTPTLKSSISPQKINTRSFAFIIRKQSRAYSELICTKPTWQQKRPVGSNSAESAANFQPWDIISNEPINFVIRFFLYRFRVGGCDYSLRGKRVPNTQVEGHSLVGCTCELEGLSFRMYISKV